LEAGLAFLGYDIFTNNYSSNFNDKGKLMTDTHRQLLDKINTIQSDETPCSSYEDTDTYRKTLADASVMLEDEIEKLKSRIA
tara:strand:- start:852 stop:1097 length:246 start_codon:yes stop_codon:yes gene_type:complete